MENKKWMKQYEKWLESCLKEYNEKYNENRKYYDFEEANEKDADPDELVEFAEDGTAYPHSWFGTNYIKNAVTSWQDSEYYME